MKDRFDSDKIELESVRVDQSRKRNWEQFAWKHLDERTGKESI